jgi:two-component system LytT family response regulator
MAVTIRSSGMRAIIVDDEPLSRMRMRQLLRSEPDVQIVTECATGAEAIEATQRLRPDVLFLDVQMPEIDGFGVLAAITDAAPLVVFVTAFDEYAVRAFDVLALDYVLKPVAAERLAAACDRARDALLRRDTPEQRDERLLALLAQLRTDGRVPDAGLKRLFVRTNGSVVVLNAADVTWIEAAGNYIRVHASSSYTVRGRLTDMETMLDPNTFARIHRSTIVNLDHVSELQPWFSGEMLVIMRDGAKLKLSRTYRHEFETRHRIFS